MDLPRTHSSYGLPSTRPLPTKSHITDLCPGMEPSMSATAEWRASVSASDRFENIQKISLALGAANHQDAFSLENEAFTTCSSLDQYVSACEVVGLRRAAVSAAGQDESRSESPGITIGAYENCHFIASGATSEVYRSKTVALKVIVETHNMEPHNPLREAKILASLSKPCIPLIETFRDREQQFTLVFPFMPLGLDHMLRQGRLSASQVRSIFKDLLSALESIHSQGIIHRDIKPAAVLLESPDGPAYLSDFGTAWHPSMSTVNEGVDDKILDIGTGPYRAPEVLFGNKSYGTPVDMWAVGAMLAECCRDPPLPLFESRAVHEDGNQLGLILSIFKTIGSPTRESWPEAASFKTPPFEMYRAFEGNTWPEILPEVDPEFRGLISDLVQFNSSLRPSAAQVSDYVYS